MQTQEEEERFGGSNQIQVLAFFCGFKSWTEKKIGELYSSTRQEYTVIAEMGVILLSMMHCKLSECLRFSAELHRLSLDCELPIDLVSLSDGFLVGGVVS